MATDVEILAAVADGDVTALRALHDLHSPWLAARLFKRCSDEGLVEEVVQDTFLAVWKGAANYRGEGDVAAWMWGIAIRRLIDRQRRKPLRWLERSRDVQSAEDAVLAGVGYGDLGPALDALSPELMAVVQATVLDGLTARETARLLGIPAGTVKTRLMRAKQVMREQLA